LTSSYLLAVIALFPLEPARRGGGRALQVCTTGAG